MTIAQEVNDYLASNVVYNGWYPQIVESTDAPIQAVPKKSGDHFVDSTMGGVYTANGTSGMTNWKPHLLVGGPSQIYDDFHYYISPHMWTTESAGVAASSTAAVSASIPTGNLLLTTHTDSGDYASVHSSVALIEPDQAPWRLAARIKLGALTNQATMIGICDQVDCLHASGNGVFMELSSSNEDATEWHLGKNTAGTPALQATGSVGNATDYSIVELRCYDKAAVKAYVNGVDVTPGTAVAVVDDVNSYIIMEVETLTTAAATLNVDWVYFETARV